MIWNGSGFLFGEVALRAASAGETVGKGSILSVSFNVFCLSLQRRDVSPPPVGRSLDRPLCRRSAAAALRTRPLATVHGGTSGISAPPPPELRLISAQVTEPRAHLQARPSSLSHSKPEFLPHIPTERSVCSLVSPGHSGGQPPPSPGLSNSLSTRLVWKQHTGPRARLRKAGAPALGSGQKPRSVHSSCTHVQPTDSSALRSALTRPRADHFPPDQTPASLSWTATPPPKGPLSLIFPNPSSFPSHPDKPESRAPPALAPRTSPLCSRHLVSEALQKPQGRTLAVPSACNALPSDPGTAASFSPWWEHLLARPAPPAPGNVAPQPPLRPPIPLPSGCLCRHVTYPAD